MVLFKILGWSEPVQRVMRADRVIDALPSQEGAVKGDDLQRPVVHFVELLGMSALTSLHMAVELGSALRTTPPATSGTGEERAPFTPTPSPW